MMVPNSAGSGAPAGTVTSPSITQDQLRKIALWEAGLLRLHSSLLNRVIEGESVEDGNYSIDRKKLESAARRAMTLSCVSTNATRKALFVRVITRIKSFFRILETAA